MRKNKKNGIETGYGGEASSALCLTGVYIGQRGGADTAKVLERVGNARMTPSRFDLMALILH